jgi:hypothetical protein
VASTSIYLSENGRMSLEVLRKKDADYADAVDHGLRWTVLKAEVRTRYPAILPLIQGAKNVGGHVARKISEAQGLQQLHTLAAQAAHDGKDADWIAIKRAVLRSRPPFAESIDDMIAFLATRSGGPDGKHLKGFLAFYRAFVDPSVRASVPAALYSALASFPDQLVAMAILQAAYSCPKEHVKNGQCLFISAGDVHGLSRNKPKEVEDAGKALGDARLHAIEAGLSQPLHENNHVLKAFTKFDVAMARFLLNKQGSSKDSFTSIGAIGHALAKALKDLRPDLDWAKLDAQFPAIATPSVPVLAEAKTGGSIALYTSDIAGHTISALAKIRKRGIDIGSCVAMTDSADLFRVASINSQQAIVLEPWKAKAAKDSNAEVPDRLVDVESFLEEWSLRDPKAALETHPGWPSCRTSKLDVADTRFMLGHIYSAMAILTKVADDYFSFEGRVDVFSKPKRAVKAKADIGAGVLVLVPETISVKTTSRAEHDPRVDAHEVRFVPPHATTIFTLQPQTSDTNMSPFWCVATTEDEEAANMVVAKVSITSMFAVDFLPPKRPKLCQQKTRQNGKAPEKASPEDSAETVSTTFPILMNSKDLTKGEELLLFKPRGEKRLAPVKEISIADLAKRAKIGSAHA